MDQNPAKQNVPAPFERPADELRRENDVLRSLLANLPQAPCAYCGLTDMSKCRHGFPGCPKADDLLCGEDETMRAWLAELRAARAALRAARAASTTAEAGRAADTFFQQHPSPDV